MKEMLALVIDRATSAIVSDINYEIGKTAQYSRQLSGRPRVYDTEYERLLREYVEMKLHLHQLRRSMYYPFDSYAEREGDFAPILERCRELRRQIKTLRETLPSAAWGDAPPNPKPTAWDKPLLYALEDATCSWDHYRLSGEYGCTSEATEWYQGVPYCKFHIGQVRYQVRRDRKAKQHEARARYKMDDPSGVMWDRSLPRASRPDPDIVHAPAEGEP